MSSIIRANVTVQNKEFLKDALDDLNYSYTVNENIVETSGKYGKMVFNTTSGEVEYDDMDQSVLTKILNHYAKHEMINILHGMNVSNLTVHVNEDQIEIEATY